ncbi:uncharacterized protein LOC123554695 [Mercenaria mercenaria]|uniref:uncharacterized protein LOC123554695 n=1 Tax=Mercenaria mercenaria TaxID=6596 RepID=UPI00234EC48A|nr:uncharacterized protein LOC123554695 [Mercenaria mercenaria]
MPFSLTIPSTTEVNMNFTAVSCDEEGDYNIILNDAVSATLTLKVVSESAIPEINIPDKVYLGQEAEVECTALIGKGESGQTEGQLLLETNFGDNGSNVTYNGSDTLEEDDCYFKASISVPIPTSKNTTDLWAQCVIRPLQGDDLLSEKKVIHILTFVNLEGLQFKIFTKENNEFWHFDGNNPNVKAVSSRERTDFSISSNIVCDSVSQTTGIGESVMFTCALEDITNITSVIVTKNSTEFIKEDNVILPYIKDDMPFTLTIPSITELNMTFTAVSCEEEGDYIIILNEVLSATLTLNVECT